MSWSRRKRAMLVALAGWMLSQPAAAGSATHIGVVGITPDGRYFAEFQQTDGLVRSCWLTTRAPTPNDDSTSASLANAACLDSEERLLPLARWKWSRTHPQIRALRPFSDDPMAGAPVRMTTDIDTRVRRIELLHQGSWYPIMADDSGGVSEAPADLRYASPALTDTSDWRALTGFLRVGDGYLIRFWRSKELRSWDEVVVISDRAVSDTSSRFAAARAKAADLTKRLREQHAARAGIFIDTVAGPINPMVRNRKRAAAAREGVRLWEMAASFGQFGAAEVRDVLWLFAWLDLPSRRLEALRFYLRLRDRDESGAESIVRELAAEPVTAWLATHLRTARDPLRGLPDVAGPVITDAALVGLSAEQLRVLHLAQWAAQGGYRFQDPKLQQYFEQFPWYAPIGKQEFRRWWTKEFRANPDARLLRMDHCARPSGACKASLEAILRAERALGSSPPALCG
jgi:hypothetical protein